MFFRFIITGNVMKFLFNATPFALIAMLASGCGYDYTCKGLEENNKKFEEAKNKGDKATALAFVDHMTRYYESYPTSGKTLECTLANGKKEEMIFSQREKDNNLEFYKNMKKNAEKMP